MKKKFIKKPWGSEEIIQTNKHYTLKTYDEFKFKM